MEKTILQKLVDYGNYKNDRSKAYLDMIYPKKDIEVFFSILLSTYCTDGKLGEVEIDEFSNLVFKSKLFFECFEDPDEDFQKYLERFYKDYINDNFNNAFEHDTSIISDELKLTVFCKCCDIILSKQILSDADVYYLNSLRGLLEIDYSRAQEIIEIFMLKNKY